MEKPRLKAFYTPEVLGSDKVFLLGERRQGLVHGAPAATVLPFLDGRHTVADIAGELSAELSAAEVLFAVHKYETLGHLVEGRPELGVEELAHWDALEVDPALARARVDAARVPVVAVGDVDPAPVVEALHRAGIATVEDDHGDRGDHGGNGVPTLVVTRDYLEPGLETLNTAHLASGRPWLLVKPEGESVWLGPLLTPGHSGCWSCLHQRLDGNRQIERYLAKRGDGGPFLTSRASTPSRRAFVAAALADQLLTLLGTGSSVLDGRLVALDPRRASSTEHVLVRQPQCPSCGDPSLMASRDPRIVLAAAPVAFRDDGGYRVQTPQATFDRLEKHVSPLLGAVSTLARTFGDSNGITFSYVAGHNFAAPGDNINLLRRNVRGQSGGKGRTDIQARVSGVCEAIERYSGVHRGDEPSVRAAYDELDPATTVHPNTMLGFSERQYDARALTNAEPGVYLHLVPERFRTAHPVEWTTAWSLTADAPRLVPSAHVWYGHPDLDDHFFCFGDSNGNASGNTLEEAILQGFCEVVERDSVALWWYSRARRPAVDMDALGEPYVDTLREFYAGMGRSLWLLDLTTDLGVTAIAAVSHRIGHPAEDVLLGFGAHLDPRMAAMRALTEINQFLPAVEARDEHGATLYREDDAATLRWWRTVHVADEPWLAPDPQAPARTAGDLPMLARDDLAESVRACMDRVTAVGLDMIVLPQSRPDLELEVAKVMVPGMRHFWRRLGPGRLYDVPARLGWVDRPLTEDDVNPHSVFF